MFYFGIASDTILNFCLINIEQIFLTSF
jgi:hypothetical protein